MGKRTSNEISFVSITEQFDGINTFYAQMDKSFDKIMYEILRQKLPPGRDDSYFYKPAGMTATNWHSLMNGKLDIEKERVRIWLLRLCLLMGLDQKTASLLMAAALHPFAFDPISCFVLSCISKGWKGMAMREEINLYFREYYLYSRIPEQCRIGSDGKDFVIEGE